MTLNNLHHLEANLWEAADQLRANSRLTATEYSMPVLGLIFLRHATNRFEAVEQDIKASLPTRGGQTRPSVFISYNHKDEKEKDQLLTHLRILEKNSLVDLWHDEQIRGGEDWKQAIKTLFLAPASPFCSLAPIF